MLKLFKYELRKTLMAKLILLGLTACLEAYFLYAVYSGRDANTATIAIMLLCLDALMGIMFIGIQSIVTLHHDMNTKQSYMLFMTPHSNYAILGAKALECTVSVAIAGLFFFGLGALDVRLMFGEFGNIKQLLDFMKQIIESMHGTLLTDLPTIAAFVFNMVASWIETVMLAFFADVIATALLKGKKFGGLLTFIFFIVLSAVTTRIVGLLPEMASVTASMLKDGAAMLAIGAAVYIGTATVMEKKLSV